jgi:aminoglycoside phosphotransferase (APT) family kinase protein
MFDGDARRLEKWLEDRMEGASSVTVARMYRLSAGFSNETFGLDVRWRVGDRLEQRPFVLRAGPEGPGLIEPYDVGRQFRIMAALRDSPVPVPRMLWLEEGSAVLRRPFFVMEMLDGEQFEHPLPSWLVEADPEVHQRICEQYVDALVELHTLDHRRLALDSLGSGAGFLGDELDRWTSALRGAQLREVPAFDALIERLQRSMPASSPGPTLVHGDTKWGNFMFQGDQLLAVLDWEMAAIGDPLVDVAYSLTYWRTGPGGLTGGLAVEDFIARYEAGTGFTVPDLAWYENLNVLKLAAIFVRAAMLFETRQRRDLRYCWMVLALPRLMQGALTRVGLDAEFDVRSVLPHDDRILEGCVDAVEEAVLPELSSQDARTQGKYLRVALRYLAASGEGTVDVPALFASN